MDENEDILTTKILLSNPDAFRDLLVYRIITTARTESAYQPNLSSIQHHQEGTDTVAPYMHEAVSDRLRSLVRFYKLSPKTFFLAASILDRFLSIVKVRPRHLMCVSIAAFYITVKIVEKKENVMSRKHLVHISQCGCLANDVARMENIIADKLKKDFDAPTSFMFLKLFYSYCHLERLLEEGSVGSEELFMQMVLKMEACLCLFSLVQFRPCVLALSILSHELPNLIKKSKSERGNLSWIRAVWELQKITQVTDTELLYCRAQVGDCLRRYASPVNRMPFSKLVWIVSRRTARVLRFTSKIAASLPTIPEHDSVNSSLMEQMQYVPYSKDQHILFPPQHSLPNHSSNVNSRPCQNLAEPTPCSNHGNNTSSPCRSPLNDVTSKQLNVCIEPKRLFGTEKFDMEYCAIDGT